MCGIAGLVYHDRSRPCDRDAVVRMRDIMPYRGPDDAGEFFEGPVGFGFRRLSIIDLSGGHQPMLDAADAHCIIFNGEIYNYRSLRADLVNRGHVFQTHSDTEVILQLYAAHGERCVEFLNGMFAFAVWDRARRSVFLARDRMGVKPLYYTENADGVAFASEIKSLFAGGTVKPACRREALAEYMLFRQVAGPDTLFEGVKSLPPGCTMTIRDGRVAIQRYWSPSPASVGTALSHGEALETFGSLLEDSVRLRLVSDVPVGTFCSGGVDSSLVTALAARLKGDPVNTYSIGFDEPDFDESAQALQVSQHCGTVHHQLKVGNTEFSELFPRMVWHNDEPLDFANSVQIFALSRLAKQRVTVVLTGEGSDELFGGYPRYRIPDLARYARLVPGPIRRLAASLTGDHRLAKLDRYAAYSAEDAILYNIAYNRPEAVAALCPTLPPFASPYRRERLDASRALGLDSLGRVSLFDQETFLVGILNRQDKMSMAASIESRVPFMDYRLVEFANRLPSALKVAGGTGKALVKDFARTLLPAEIVDQRKSGFGVPLARWFRAADGLGARLRELPSMPGADLFDQAALTALIAEHRGGTHDHSELLWTALNLATWRETFAC
jgi:asparagine synthase (glutamine-hydrolysing)